MGKRSSKSNRGKKTGQNLNVKESKDRKNNENIKSLDNNIGYSESASLTQEQIIALHEEAYYRAIKRLRDEEKRIEKEIPKKKYKWYEDVFFFLNVCFFPWKICKKYTIKNTIYDSVLVFFVSLILIVAGAIMWILGLLGTGWQAYQLLIKRSIIELETFMLMVTMTVFGSFFILSGQQFEKETDSTKIYAYSASIIALISCVVAIIAIVTNAS